jgi:hypothetical protein
LKLFGSFPGIFSWQVSITLNYRAFAGVFDRLEATAGSFHPLPYDFSSENSRKQPYYLLYRE